MNEGLIQIDGKFYKKCKVVMLATEEIGNIRLNTIHNHLCYGNDLADIPTQPAQHLYILSDEEIKENMWDKYPIGTWYYSTVLNEIKQLQPKEKAYDPSGFIIIATTDSLIINDWLEVRKNKYEGEYELSNYIPRLSDAFIQKYIEEYNKGNVIEEVLVEYEKYDPSMWSRNSDDTFDCVTCDKEDFDENQGCNCKEEIIIKIASDNTITIKAVVETWDDIAQGFLNTQCGYSSEPLMRWLKENYQVPKKK